MLKRRRGRNIKSMFRASYTVEASFIFPIAILVIAFMLRLSIGLYANVKSEAITPQTIKEINTLEIFLEASGSSLIEGVVDGLSE